MLIPIAWMNAGLALLVIALSLPMLLGKVPRNRFYGARLKASYHSDANWYRINKASAIYMMVWAGVLMLLNMAVLLLTAAGLIPALPWLVVFIAVSPLVLLIAAVQTWLFARRAIL